MSHTAATLSLNTRQKITVHVAALGEDGQTPDATAQLTTSTSNPFAATGQVASGDPRAVEITGNTAAGSANITVGFSGCGDTLIIPVSVSLAPNLSRVDFVTADPPVAK